MPKMVWDQAGERTYETGVSECALYVAGTGATYQTGVPWNGLTGVTETPSGAEETALYANNSKYLSLRSAEEFGGTIEAYTYPDDWAQCDGSATLVTGVHIGQQNRKSFGLAYKTVVGNDTEGEAHGYKLHLIYGASVSPSERAYATINDSPEAITFSWEFTTTPVSIDSTIVGTSFKKTSILTIDTTELTGGKDNTKLATLEGILYGTGADAYVEATDVTSENFASKKGNLYTKDGSTYTSAASATYSSSATYYYKNASPRLPLPEEVFTIFNAA